MPQRVKQKWCEDIVNEFQSIFTIRKSKLPRNDEGSEYRNKLFQKLLKQEDVQFFTTFNNSKALIVEGFSRSLKTKMWKYFKHNHTYRYVDVLDQLLHGCITILTIRV